MKLIFLLSTLFVCVILNAQTRYDVRSGAEFVAAQEMASAGDSIVWAPGIYTNTRMDIDKDGLIVTAEPYGAAFFTGVSRAVINANNITFSGFQYVGGFIGTLDVVRVFGSDVLITHVNIQNYTSFKYLVVDEESRRTTISYCNFENRLNLDDKNILSILVDDEPGFHKIQHCSFKNFDGTGGDQGIEPIRIGVSTQAHLDSRTLVEYCYFTRCSGDGEIISHKARQNVYRYNTFEDNPQGELVLRHGDEGIVYGNFFLNSMGGIRIREGSNHFVFNNYFQGLHRRTIYLMNDPVDPLSDIHIYHNTIVDSEEVILGGAGANAPTNVTIANNIFINPRDQLLEEQTGEENWLNNLSLGPLGIDRPSSGLSETDPGLFENTEGYLQPESDSPVINAAGVGYPEVPLYPGMDYDNEITLDLMKESRPANIDGQAIGASEFSSTVTVQPHATEMNTGPSYLFDKVVDYVTANASTLFIEDEGERLFVWVSSNIDWEVMSNDDWITTEMSSGSGDERLIITIAANEVNVRRMGSLSITGGTQTVTINVNQDPGELVSVHDNLENDVVMFPNPTEGQIKLSNLPSGSYSSQVEVVDINGKTVFSNEYLILDRELVIDVENLTTGTYLINAKFSTLDAAVIGEMTRQVVKN